MDYYNISYNKKINIVNYVLIKKPIMVIKKIR